MGSQESVIDSVSFNMMSLLEVAKWAAGGRALMDVPAVSFYTIYPDYKPN